MMSENHGALTMSAQEVAEAVGIDVKTFRRAVARGEAPAGGTVGRRRLWARDAIERWVSSGFKMEGVAA